MKKAYVAFYDWQGSALSMDTIDLDRKNIEDVRIPIPQKARTLSIQYPKQEAFSMDDLEMCKECWNVPDRRKHCQACFGKGFKNVR